MVGRKLTFCNRGAKSPQRKRFKFKNTVTSAQRAFKTMIQGIPTHNIYKYQ